MSLKEGYPSSSGYVSFTKKWHNKPYPFISPNQPELSAAGKNVVVTGGGSGIGLAAAIAFAQAGAASIAVIGRRRERLQAAAADIRAAGPRTRVICEPADMAKLADADRALKNIFNEVGKIDVLISGAGIMPTIGSVQGYSDEDFRRGLEVNVMSAFNAIQGFLPLAAPNAKLFNVSSGMGHIAPVPGLMTYSVAKAAVIRLFDYAASEHPKLHVVNIQPGVVVTDLNKVTGMPGQDERTCSYPIV